MRRRDEERLRKLLPQIGQSGRGGARVELVVLVLFLPFAGVAVGHGRSHDRRRDGNEPIGCRCDRLTRLQAPHHREPEVAARLNAASRGGQQSVGTNRNGDVEAPSDVDAKEIRRRDADDVELRAVEADGLPQGRRAATEGPLPVRVTEHRRRRTAAGPIVAGLDQAADRRPDTEHVERLAADPERVGVLHFAARGGIQLETAPRKQAGEHIFETLLAELIDLSGGHERHPAREAAAQFRSAREMNHDQRVRIHDGQRAEPHRIKQLEDRRVRTNAQGERQDGRHGEALVAPQQPGRVLQVLPDRIGGPHGIHPIDLLAHTRRIAELADRRIVRCLERHAARDVVVGFNGDVGRDLPRRLIVTPLTPKESR